MQTNSSSVVDKTKETLAVLVLIWSVFFLDIFLPLETLGVLPRTLRGLMGVVAMPFLHADWSHLINNSIPLLILLTILKHTTINYWQVIISIVLGSGALLWLLGRESLHIGASGLVFGLIGYLIVAGFKRKNILSVAGTIVVLSLYGGSILTGISPLQKHISWEGHFFGLLVGIYLAFKIQNKNNIL